jgi:hypothetical protein
VVVRRPAAASESELGYTRYAKAMFRRDRRSEHPALEQGSGGDPKAALAEGLPYQTLISSLLHKYASGRLKEV